ncbi:MAG: AAA family ATPase [Oligoflexia bacterium]|nr:AAA family ATPase [Oligoflexia bacterium]
MKNLSSSCPVNSTVHDFKVFINSFHPIVVIETSEERRVHELLSSVALQLDMDLEEWTATYGIKNKWNNTKLLDTQNPSGLISYMERRQGEVIYLLKDFHSCLEDLILIRSFRELLQKFSKNRSTVFLTGSDIKLPSEINTHGIRYDLKTPSKEELRQLIRNVHHSLFTKYNITYELDRKGEQSLLSALSGMTIDQARQAVASAFLEGKALTYKDIPKILKKKASLINEGGILEFVPAVENHFQLGGFDNLKKWLKKIQVGFGEEARKVNLPLPKGILMVGVPGCGKSLSAKVVAQMWGFPLLKLDTGRLFDKYIGESEKKFRKCIQIATAMSPSVLWIDEIEKALLSGGNSENDGGLGRRIFGAFLTWLQEKDKPVFVVATANQIHQMPPELLRKGRFDEIFFVDLPSKLARKEIFKIHLIHRNLIPENYEIDLLAEESEGMSGAEIEQSVLSSLYSSFHEKAGHNTDLILKEIKQTCSLFQSKREFIEELRARYKSRFAGV